jgi:hypothetical protein
MPTYELPYAAEHLGELFQQAHSGAAVIIVRIDGKSCQLLPTAEIPEVDIPPSELSVPDDSLTGGLVPA